MSRFDKTTTSQYFDAVELLELEYFRGNERLETNERMVVGHSDEFFMAPCLEKVQIGLAGVVNVHLTRRNHIRQNTFVRLVALQTFTENYF